MSAVKLVDFTMGISVQTFDAWGSTRPLEAGEALGRLCMKCGTDLTHRGGFLFTERGKNKTRTVIKGGGICAEDLAKVLESIKLWGYSEFRGILGPATDGTIWIIDGGALAQAWRDRGREGLEEVITASRAPVSMKTPEGSKP